jgi:hypothetical protein
LLNSCFSSPNWQYIENQKKLMGQGGGILRELYRSMGGQIFTSEYLTFSSKDLAPISSLFEILDFKPAITYGTIS